LQFPAAPPPQPPRTRRLEKTGYFFGEGCMDIFNAPTKTRPPVAACPPPPVFGARLRPVPVLTCCRLSACRPVRLSRCRPACPRTWFVPARRHPAVPALTCGPVLTVPAPGAHLPPPVGLPAVPWHLLPPVRRPVVPSRLSASSVPVLGLLPHVCLSRCPQPVPRLLNGGGWETGRQSRCWGTGRALAVVGSLRPSVQHPVARLGSRRGHRATEGGSKARP
jgi:hypothetical protein